MKAECPECGWSKEVADHAKGKKGECPECGRVFRIGEGSSQGGKEKGVAGTTATSPAKAKLKKAGYALATVTILLLIVGLVLSEPPEPESDSGQQNEPEQAKKAEYEPDVVEAYSMAQIYLERQMDAPDKLEYPSVSRVAEMVNHLGAGHGGERRYKFYIPISANGRRLLYSGIIKDKPHGGWKVQEAQLDDMEQ